MNFTPVSVSHYLALYVFFFVAAGVTFLIGKRGHDLDALLQFSSSFKTTHTDAKEFIEFPLNCSSADNPYPSTPYNENNSSSPSPSSCPDYFRWIYEDLLPWRESGITGEMVADAAKKSNFRLVILNGTVYLETYIGSFHTRDKFTVWGILQLVRRYPGRIRDLDMVFNCGDLPVSKKETGVIPLPVFGYCRDETTANIVFPDWSFWGWPEVNIKPWTELAFELKAASERLPWPEREPYAYWKGNPSTHPSRADLLNCNVSDKQEWNARVYVQDWVKENREGFKESDLASQCKHRYKIYIEGIAWSVSEKYILACDSTTLFMKPRFFDFFTRSLMPLKHYWPIKHQEKCRSIKFAVEWGNMHQKEAMEIGKSGSSFVLDELKMDYIYDYMLYALNEYAKLLKYKPTVPEGAVEIYAETRACSETGLMRKFFDDTLVKQPNFSNPCGMPPPFSPASLHSILDLQDEGLKQVEAWEDMYWKGQGNQV